MRVIIAGSRYFTNHDYDTLEDACLCSGYWFTAVISGAAPGGDTLGERFARKFHIPLERYPADWDTYGDSAGPKRNHYMATKIGAEALVALWDGKSRGTKNMIQLSRQHGLLVYVREALPMQLPIPGEGSPYRRA